MTYSYAYDQGVGNSSHPMLVLVFTIILALILIASTWRIFMKAGIPGWCAVIPLYNNYKLCYLAMGHGLLFVLFFIPIVNVLFSFIMYTFLARAYGKGFLFGMGLVFFPFIAFPILGFGRSRYLGMLR